MLVADIEEPVVAAATRTPFESRRRVFVIERAETMNDQAANKLLKTLEEPPPFAHLCCSTERPRDVLPTIASRCQPVRFDAPPAAELAARLAADGVDAATRRARCARLALGDAERALALAAGDGPGAARGGRRFARAALRGDLAGRAVAAILARASARGEAARAERRGARRRATLELLPKKERRKRAEREGGRRAPSAPTRRARTSALDQGLQLAGLWLRDVACVPTAPRTLVHARRPARRAARGRRGPRRPPRCATASRSSTRRALRWRSTRRGAALEALASRLAPRAG